MSRQLIRICNSQILLNITEYWSFVMMPFHRNLIAMAITTAFAAPAAMAQTFMPDNLIVSRTVYQGVASTVTVARHSPVAARPLTTARSRTSSKTRWLMQPLV